MACGRLGELIHTAVRRAIEVAVHEELTAALGPQSYHTPVPDIGASLTIPTGAMLPTTPGPEVASCDVSRGGTLHGDRCVDLIHLPLP